MPVWFVFEQALLRERHIYQTFFSYEIIRQMVRGGDDGNDDMSYTGDVSVEEAWKALEEDKGAVLIDVRTQAEWAFVGICNLSEIGKAPLLVSWQEFPHMGLNPNFSQMIEGQNIAKSSPLYFLCRSGVRSQSAAAAMIAVGYENCFNIRGGFEGDIGADGHRGTCGGWKAAGLPWTQN